MRINELNGVNDFLSKYTGIRKPEDDKWFGLEFCYKGICYRFSTDWYDEKKCFCLYSLNYGRESYPALITDYTLLGLYDTVKESLSCIIIDGDTFEDVLNADDTEILSYD